MKQRSFSQWLILYIVGFGLSLSLSVASYVVVARGIFGDMPVLGAAALLGLAIIQLVVQLVCFLHLGTNPRSIFKTHTFIFTGFTLLIIVIGSLWIMANLDYRMGMSPEAMKNYMEKQNRKGF